MADEKNTPGTPIPPAKPPAAEPKSPEKPGAPAVEPKSPEKPTAPAAEPKPPEKPGAPAAEPKLPEKPGAPAPTPGPKPPEKPTAPTVEPKSPEKPVTPAPAPKPPEKPGAPTPTPEPKPPEKPGTPEPVPELKIPLTPDGQPEKIEHMKISELHDFPNHPYSVKHDAEMTDLVNSIKTHGVLNPAIVIPREQGGYEIVSGHRRKAAAKLAGLDSIPVIVRRLTRDEAIISMVDSNLQRENISPMEKANAYKMKLEAMKRTVGRRAKGAEQGPQKRADEQLAEQVGESRNTIQRMVRLTELEPGLAEMVDKGKLPVNPASDLSFLKKDEQKQLLDVMKERDITPSGQQATALKAASQNGKLSKEVIGQIMTPLRKEPELKVTLTYDKLKPYLPKKDCTPREAEAHVMAALDSFKKKLERDQMKKTGPNLNGK